MIFLIEGPNGVGKSFVTDYLYSQRRRVFQEEPFFISLPHRHADDVDYYSLGAEQRGHEIFTALYRSDSTYVFDRWSTITSVVYNRIRGVGNPTWLLCPEWYSDIRVVRLFAPPDVLLERLQSRPCCRDRYSLDRVKLVVDKYEKRFLELALRGIPILNAESWETEKIAEFVREELRR